MEAAARSFLALLPTLTSRVHRRNCSYASSPLSVLVLHEQKNPALTFIPAACLAGHSSASVNIQEQRDERRPSFHLRNNEGTSPAILDKSTMNDASSSNEEKVDPDEYENKPKIQLLHAPGLWYLFPSLEVIQPLMVMDETENLPNAEPKSVVALAKHALSASREAASLAEQSKLFEMNFDDSFNTGVPSSDLIDVLLAEERTVRSTRLLERQSRRRRVSKPKYLVQEGNCSEKLRVQRKITEAFDPNDPLRLFVGPETKLLTANEESHLIMKIQDYLELEQVHTKLQIQFGREPSLVEWGEAVGLSCRALQSQLHTGKQSREKLIHANYRMVVHIAKKYQGCGLSLPDLLQEGSKGLMKSIEKVKPQVGCRFATYASWWIRHTIRKAIFQHSRTIRLPENVHGLLSKVNAAKRTCIEQGLHRPTKEEIASCAGITVEKLEKLLFTTRMPISMQQQVWMDQGTTFQEVTANTAIEAPDLSVQKQLMRLHIRNLLTNLNPKERRIIKLRFGIGEAHPRSLSEIGILFGLSKERVRQLESRALYKLKQCLNSQGLKAYGNLVS